MYRVSEYDSGGACWRRGQTFEATAVSILNKNGVPTRPSTPHLDYTQHTDFFAYSFKWGRWLSVDAKAMKRVSRSDPYVQDRTAYVEFLNTAGGLGWLCEGADVIVFERHSTILLISRQVLLNFCQERVEEITVDSARDCLYKYYSRKGRNDLISMINLDDLPKDKTKTYIKV